MHTGPRGPLLVGCCPTYLPTPSHHPPAIFCTAPAPTHMLRAWLHCHIWTCLSIHVSHAIYRNDTEIASEKGPMGEYVEAYDTEMKALKVALKMIHEIVNREQTPPMKIILSTDNMGAVQWTFQRTPGKPPICSNTFCKNI